MAFFRDAIGEDPKRAYRWTLFTGISEIPRFTVKKVSKPSFEVGTTVHKYMGHSFKFPNIGEWTDITLTLVDFGFDSDTVGALMKYVLKAGYHPPTDAADLSNSMSKNRAVANLGLVRLSQLDSEGNESEGWLLHNAWISKITPSDLDYESEDLSSVEVTIVYDWAELILEPTRQRFFP